MTQLTSDRLLDVLRDAIKGVGGFQLSDSVFSLAADPATIQHHLVRIAPLSFIPTKQATCRSYLRQWVVECAFAERHSDVAITLRDSLLVDEDLIVDALLSCEPVTGIRGGYSRIPDQPFLLLTLQVETHSTRQGTR